MKLISMMQIDLPLFNPRPVSVAEAQLNILQIDCNVKFAAAEKFYIEDKKPSL